ncbi:hypothetical protein A7D00_7370 [Trichophyton violaceum]|uniref:HAT C-terminal dimerisation domain-containing protein n=1 Tax=Trichophyton violaceum TaxID=34388 RepID=A0A178F886_TRIVO|nr:hypothetical protein A7D00_7370 [Trichophyton violaceum]
MMYATFCYLFSQRPHPTTAIEMSNTPSSSRIEVVVPPPPPDISSFSSTRTFHTEAMSDSDPYGPQNIATEEPTVIPGTPNEQAGTDSEHEATETNHLVTRGIRTEWDPSLNLTIVTIRRTTQRIIMLSGPLQQGTREAFYHWWRNTTWNEEYPQCYFRTTGRSSHVWQLFTEGAEFPCGTPVIKCNSCATTFSHTAMPRSIGTSSLVRHLRASPLCRGPTPRVKTITEAFASQTEFMYTPERLKEYTLEFILDRCLPFALVNSPSFQRLLRLAAGNASLPIPSRHQLTSFLTEKVETSISEQLTKIPPGAMVSLALDCWTSPSTHSFMAIVLYYIDKDWEVRELLLEFAPLTGTHTGDRLAKVVFDVLVHHNLVNRVLSVTADNASNNRTLCSGLMSYIRTHGADQPGYNPGLASILSIEEHIPCILHIVNLVAKVILKSIRAEPSNDEEITTWNPSGLRVRSNAGLPCSLEKIRNLSVFITTSSKRLDLFKELQASREGGPLLPRHDCQTRWNSTLHMLARAMELRDTFTLFIQRWLDDDLSHLRIQVEEWSQLEYLFELLVPFYVVTLGVSKAADPSVNLIYDIYEYLYDHLDASIKKLKSKRVPWKVTLYTGIRAAREKLSTYYAQTNKAQGYLYAMATILDPKSKLQTFNKASWREEAEDLGDGSPEADIDWAQEYRQCFEDIFSYYRVQYPDIVVPEHTRHRTLFEHLRDKGFASKKQKDLQGKSREAIVFSEVAEYLGEGTVQDISILEYWKVNSKRFPILSMMARDILAVPPSTVGVERLFNIARDVNYFRRARLNPRTVRAIMVELASNRLDRDRLVANDPSEAEDSSPMASLRHIQRLDQVMEPTIMEFSNREYISDTEDPLPRRQSTAPINEEEENGYEPTPSSARARRRSKRVLI